MLLSREVQLNMPTQEIQRDPISTEDLAPHRGNWVAIRDGVVIATGLTPTELRDSPDVREDDYLVLVPSGTSNTLLL